MEQFNIKHAILGFCIGFAAILFTNIFILHKSHKTSSTFPLLMLVKYTIYLFIHIYLSGFSSIRTVLTGKTNVKILEYETCLDDEFMICLFANSITLTPGTVVMDKNYKLLRILCLNSPNSGDAKEIISTKIEAILKKAEAKGCYV